MTDDDTLILECIVTTLNPDGSANIAPMGPRVQRDDWSHFELRPFASSRTHANLLERPRGVLHVVDDVLLLAQAVIDSWIEPPRLQWLDDPSGWVLENACRWYAFTIESWQDEPNQNQDAGSGPSDSRRSSSPARPRLTCVTQRQGRFRDSLGFNRAKHAVVEAAILASRIGILPPEQIHSELANWKIVVDKTAGRQERQAFQLLVDYVRHAVGRVKSKE